MLMKNIIGVSEFDEVKTQNEALLAKIEITSFLSAYAWEIINSLAEMNFNVNFALLTLLTQLDTLYRILDDESERFSLLQGAVVAQSNMTATAINSLPRESRGTSKHSYDVIKLLSEFNSLVTAILLQPQR